MDQLTEWAIGGRKLRSFQYLEEVSVFAVFPFDARMSPIINPFRLPKFIRSHASVLRVPTLKVYDTDFFVPKNMPNSSISWLDMSNSYYFTHYNGLSQLSPHFLLSCSELRELSWASSNLGYFRSGHVPESVRHLKIHYTGEDRSYELGSLESPNARNDFSQLDTLEVHYRVLDYEFIRSRFFDTLQKLIVFGYEECSISDSSRLSRTSSYKNWTHVDVIQFRAAFKSHTSAKAAQAAYCFLLVKSLFGRVTIQPHISYGESQDT